MIGPAFTKSVQAWLDDPTLVVPSNNADDGRFKTWGTRGGEVMKTAVVIFPCIICSLALCGPPSPSLL